MEFPLSIYKHDASAPLSTSFLFFFTSDQLLGTPEEQECDIHPQVERAKKLFLIKENELNDIRNSTLHLEDVLRQLKDFQAHNELDSKADKLAESYKDARARLETECQRVQRDDLDSTRLAAERRLMFWLRRYFKTQREYELEYAYAHCLLTILETPSAMDRLAQYYEVSPSMFRRTLSDAARKVLQNWLDAHIESPYPTPEQKQDLSNRAGVPVDQISVWFANTRSRSKPEKPNDVKMNSAKTAEATIERVSLLVSSKHRNGTNFKPRSFVKQDGLYQSHKLTECSIGDDATETLKVNNSGYPLETDTNPESTLVGFEFFASHGMVPYSEMISTKVLGMFQKEVSFEMTSSESSLSVTPIGYALGNAPSHKRSYTELHSSSGAHCSKRYCV